jgi:hypothetical protein
MGNLTNLKTIKLSGCEMTQFPSTLWDLRSVLQIWLNDNLIEDIIVPQNKVLENLNVLNLRENRLVNFSGEGSW